MGAADIIRRRICHESQTQEHLNVCRAGPAQEQSARVARETRVSGECGWEPRGGWWEAQNLGLWKKRDMVTGSESRLSRDLNERSFSGSVDRSPTKGVGRKLAQHYKQN